MPTLRISLYGPVLIAGGRAAALGVDLATARTFNGDAEEWVPYIPATALRGAVRIQLEALLAGARRPDAGPYVLDERRGTSARDHQGPVARLFGFSGRQGERSGAKEGCLRFSDALPEDPQRAAAALRVRPGLEIDDHTAAAADQKLFFRELADVAAEPLVFLADLEFLAALAPEDRGVLRAAVETTDAIGAGKAKGGGLVRIEWLPERSRPAAKVQGDAATATRARLIFTLEEPAHCGDGGPQGNHHGTRSYLPGATVRGAVAWALLRAGVKPESPGFQRLFVERPAHFGDALPVSGLDGEPVLRPATARQRRGGGKEVHDILLSELARDRVNARLTRLGLYLRADDGSVRFDPAPTRPARDLVRRTRTRVSIDRYQGTAASSRLFSIEQIEPWLAAERGKKPRRATFAGWVEGLDAAGAALLRQAAGLPILVGAGRNHGLGRTTMEVRFASEPDPAEAEARLLALADRAEAETIRLLRRAKLASATPEAGTLPLVLVALADFVPTDPAAPHPLAEPELAGLPPVPAGPSRRFLTAGATGGYDQSAREGRLKDLIPTVGAGSVFVYAIERAAQRDWLRQALPRLRRGVGAEVASGCGRFALFELPQQTAKESTMDTEQTAAVKRWLVDRAETILNAVQDQPGFGGNQGATSQLRNLLQIAQQESEVPVLRNFIRYQTGRKATKNFWSLIYKEVIQVLEEIERKPELQKVEARRLAIQQFFGYMVRHYVYLYEVRPPKPPRPPQEGREGRRAKEGERS